MFKYWEIYERIPISYSCIFFKHPVDISLDLRTSLGQAKKKWNLIQVDLMVFLRSVLRLLIQKPSLLNGHIAPFGVVFQKISSSLLSNSIITVSIQHLAASSHRLAAISCQLLDVSHPLAVVIYQLSVINHKLSVIRIQLSEVSYQLSVISNQ